MPEAWLLFFLLANGDAGVTEIDLATCQQTMRRIETVGPMPVNPPGVGPTAIVAASCIKRADLDKMTNEVRFCRDVGDEAEC